MEGKLWYISEVLCQRASMWQPRGWSDSHVSRPGGHVSDTEGHGHGDQDQGHTRGGEDGHHVGRRHQDCDNQQRWEYCSVQNEVKDD